MVRLPGASSPAPCVGKTELFFAPLGVETSAARDAREMAARSLCAGCDDRGRCLATAIAAGSPAGIWGGYTDDERRQIARERRRRQVPKLV